MFIQQKVLDSIRETLGRYYDVEAGGILGMNENTVDHFYFDRASDFDLYIPDVHRINNVIDKWYHTGIEFAGIVHSHTLRKTLSFADIEYARDILLSNSLQMIYMALYVKDGNLFLPYCVNLHEVKLDTAITI